MLIELHGVNELANQKESPASRFIKLCRLNRLRNGGGIEPGTLIGDVQRDGFRHQLGPDLDPLITVLAIAPEDGIAERLGENHPQPKSGGGCGRVAGQAMAGDQLYRFLDTVDVAGKPQGDQSGRPSGSRRRGPADTEAERRSHSRLLEAGQGLLGGFGDGEEGIQLGELEQRAEIVIEAGESELASRLTNPLG